MKRYLLLILVLSGNWLLQGQQPDHEIDFFYPIGDQVTPAQTSASALLYSDGTNLAIYIEVKDRDIQIRKEDRQTDHVRLWLALPQTAYPENFEYRFHPEYITSIPYGRGAETSPRYFSIHGDAGANVSLRPFVEDFDYPNPKPYARYDSLWVPAVTQLKEQDLHYGLVELALFADGRPPRLINQRQLKVVEKSLGVEMGDISRGVVYRAERTEQNDGYILNVQLSPQALGFVQLPYMKRIRVLMEVACASYPGALAKPLLVSKAYARPPMPSTFDLVSFVQPIRTNFTPIPDDLFFAAQLFPVYAYSRADWQPTAVDIDALMYRPRQLSQSLTEVQISRPQVNYYEQEFAGQSVQRLSIAQQYVNKRMQVEDYTRIGEQIFHTTRTRLDEGDPTLPEDGLFLFQDKSLGLILKSSRYLDPYGWADDADAQEETIDFYKLTEREHWPVLSVQQQDGKYPFCRIGNQQYDGFFILFMNWVDPGRRMVFYLNHHETKEAKRITARWDRHGEKVEIKEIE